jgi:hydroxypyruvate isomerase
VYRLSPNIELLFTEAGSDYADRISAAAAAGFDAVEMWGTSSHNIPSLCDRLQQTGVALTSVLAEPRTNFTLPGTDLGPFFDGLDRAVENARELNCPRVVLGSGVGFPGAKRQPQLDRLVDVFSQAVKRTDGSGVKLILEPVNTRVDHPGALLDRTAEAVYIARGVGSDRFGLLYDMYHSLTEGEDPAVELANAGDLIDYVQIADSPGRGEPGSGAVDWPNRLAVLRKSGYAGPLGLEYFPTVESTASLAYIKAVAASA